MPKVKDLYLDVENSYVIVSGKGNKKRPLILPEKTVEIIKLYIQNNINY
jgi:site-specific recombinase XerC